MKIYSNKFELRTPTDRRYYAAPNSVFAIGVKATLDGEDAEGTIKVYQGSTELTPMEATVDGYTLYKRTSGSDTAVNEFDVVYTKDGKAQHFKLIENITDSTVFDIDQEGGAETDPVFTTWKNGQELAAGKDSFATGENTTAVGPYAVASGNDSLAVGFEAAATAQGAIQIGMGSNAEINTVKIRDYKVLEANGKIPSERLSVATTTTAGAVIVGSGLSVDTDGKLNAVAQGGGYNAAVIARPFAQGEWYISQGVLKEQPFVGDPYTDPIVNPPVYCINPYGQYEVHAFIIVENGVEAKYECVSEGGMPLNYQGTPMFLLKYENGEMYFWGYNSATYAWGDPMPDGDFSDMYLFRKINR